MTERGHDGHDPGVTEGDITPQPGVELAAWQLAACDAWARGDESGAHRGTIEVFTGGGKSLIALECLRRASTLAPDLRAMIVVPTLALARQWRSVVLARTTLTEDQIGALDGERKDDLADKTLLIAVLNSAAEHLPDMAAPIGEPLMLIVDECHRAGAPVFSRVLHTKADFRLGLSATAEREDVDEDGIPIEYEDHVLGQQLGRIVYKFDLRAAREVGWLPEFSVHHHGVTLTDPERRKYEELTRRIDDLADRLQDLGVDGGGARSASTRPGEVGTVARAYVGAVSLRKDLLYRATERSRVTRSIVTDLDTRALQPRILLFHERVDEAIALHGLLSSAGLRGDVGLEHSRLPEKQRRASLDRFAAGSAPILVSVKALVEGIDVPDADVGISVASSASVRQRVQALGRVLRRRFDGTTKNAEMHVLYVSDTVDEAIYAKEDWSDLTGAETNRYFLWAIDSDSPTVAPGPPRTPKPTEEQFWEQLGRRTPDAPVEWTPDWPSQEWRLDGRGSITDLTGRLVNNPQHAPDAVRQIKPGGGRFRVSHRHRLIVVPERSSDTVRLWLVGQLSEPFALAQSTTDDASQTRPQMATPSQPGAPYEGRTDRELGTYRVRQKSGGLIERRTARGSEFAGTRDDEGPSTLVSNARVLLAAWRQTGESGLTFHVNANGDAFYTSEGEVRFLARVPDGFAWPSSETEAPT